MIDCKVPKRLRSKYAVIECSKGVAGLHENLNGSDAETSSVQIVSVSSSARRYDIYIYASYDIGELASRHTTHNNDKWHQCPCPHE